jgi:hypothetical protein
MDARGIWYRRVIGERPRDLQFSRLVGPRVLVKEFLDQLRPLQLVLDLGSQDTPRVDLRLWVEHCLIQQHCLSLQAEEMTITEGCQMCATELLTAPLD